MKRRGKNDKPISAKRNLIVHGHVVADGDYFYLGFSATKVFTLCGSFENLMNLFDSWWGLYMGLFMCFRGFCELYEN